MSHMSSHVAKSGKNNNFQTIADFAVTKKFIIGKIVARDSPSNILKVSNIDMSIICIYLLYCSC